GWFLLKYGFADPSEPLVAVPFGVGGDLPLTGDWDGNGTTTLGIYRRDVRQFWLTDSEPQQATYPADVNVVDCPVRDAEGVCQTWEAEDVPLAGDWDGNGTTTLGFYRPSTNTFFLRNCLTFNDPCAAPPVPDGAVPRRRASPGPT